jgi:hypothetical protein
MIYLRIIAITAIGFSASVALAQSALQYRNDAKAPDPRGADYLLPYGTYSGQYSNWRTYGLVGDRIAQYGPLSNKDVPRGKYNVKTGKSNGFGLTPR